MWDNLALISIHDGPIFDDQFDVIHFLITQLSYSLRQPFVCDKFAELVCLFGNNALWCLDPVNTFTHFLHRNLWVHRAQLGFHGGTLCYADAVDLFRQITLVEVAYQSLQLREVGIGCVHCECLRFIREFDYTAIYLLHFNTNSAQEVRDRRSSIAE